MVPPFCGPVSCLAFLLFFFFSFSSVYCSVSVSVRHRYLGRWRCGCRPDGLAVGIKWAVLFIDFV